MKVRVKSRSQRSKRHMRLSCRQSTGNGSCSATPTDETPAPTSDTAEQVVNIKPNGDPPGIKEKVPAKVNSSEITKATKVKHNHRRMLPSKAGLGKVKEWVVNHPDTTRFIAKMAVATLTDAGFKYITGKKRVKAKIVPGSQRGVSTSKSNSVTGSVAKVITSAVDAAETTPRSTPVQHLVKDHIRHRNGKEIHVASYQRGGKK